MIGIAQPRTTVAMVHKSVSQPYTNYLNVTTIKTTFLADRYSVFPTQRLPLMILRLSNQIFKKNSTYAACECFMLMRKLEGIRVYRILGDAILFRRLVWDPPRMKY